MTNIIICNTIITVILIGILCLIKFKNREEKTTKEALNRNLNYIREEAAKDITILKEVCIQAELDELSYKQYFETHRRNSYGIVCPVRRYNIYYFKDGTKLEEPIINGNYNMTTIPTDTIHITLGVKKEYEYEKCEDCKYWHTHCKLMKEFLNNSYDKD